MGMVELYTAAKFEGKKFDYKLTDKKLLDRVWQICDTSYGLLIYQEQCIKCFTDIGGFNEIEGDNGRRALGKKKANELTALKGKFIEGGVNQGYDKDNLAILFEQIEGFSGYGFNKSHAVAYSVLTCITSYLSANYPLEFYTAAFTIDSGNTDDVRKYVFGAQKRGLTVLPPRLNESTNTFTIAGNSIIFGLTAIKGVGDKVAKTLIKRRPKDGYASFGSFIEKNIDLINKKVLDSYIKAGVFTNFGYSKNTLLNSIENILEFLSIMKDLSNSYTNFDLFNIPIGNYIESQLLEFSNQEDDLYYEIESLGLYITKHPMEECLITYESKNPKETIKSIENIIEDLKDDPYAYEGVKVTIPGAIAGIEVRKTKAKLNMASFLFTSHISNIKAMVFSKAYSNPDLRKYVTEGNLCQITGYVKVEDDDIQLVVNAINDPLCLSRIIPIQEEYVKPEISLVEDVKYFEIKNMKLIFEKGNTNGKESKQRNGVFW